MTKATNSSDPDVATPYLTTQPAAMDSDITTTLKEFTLFPKLPAEMRCKIWFHSLPGPRVVEIDYQHPGAWVCRQESQGTPSGMLRANKESRAEFLKYYSPFIEVTIPVEIVISDDDDDENEDDDEDEPQLPYLTLYGSVTYIDPTIDTLYISASHNEEVSITSVSMRELVPMECLRTLQTLACEYGEIRDGYRHLVGKSLTSFLPNINYILVVDGDLTFHQLFNHEMERSTGEITFMDPEDEPTYSLEQHAAFLLRIEEAKKLFLDPAGRDLAICSTTRILRDGVEMDFEIS
ncbi:hypothetical protein DL98DRAFT_633380 [Cadophora sp. DSE1049]|nr:hypothetical protein DL98DRAFT_633380 [Cadophora sp. DSE1049]